jgi:AcrR family transcriptional regulator
MVNFNPETEIKIKKAAKEIFLQYGKDGARMQMIAQRAGVNKALLHYYFRSKERLFYEILKDSILDLFVFLDNIPPEVSFKNFLWSFIDAHIDFVRKHHQLVMFLLWEFRKNKKHIKELISEMQSTFPIHPRELLWNRIQQAVRQGEIQPVDPNHLIFNLLGLDILPFVVQPIFQMVFELQDEQYEELLNQRKEQVFSFVWNAIKSQPTGA